MKKIWKIVFLFLISFILVTGCGEKKDEEHIDLDPDSAVLKSQVIDGLKISELSIVYENDISRLVANVENTNQTDYPLRVISIKLYDGAVLLVDTTGYIGTNIKAKETKQLIVEVTKNLKEADKVEYKILK